MLADFATAIHLTHSRAISFKLDKFTDKWLNMSHLLIAQPGTLRNDIAISISPFFGNRAAPNTKGGATTHLINYLTN